MKIGIDFDHTIVNYEDAFYQAALEKQIIPKNLGRSKTEIRNYFRSQGREDEWTLLQGYVYGARMDLAAPFEGFVSFVQDCITQNIELAIISHKTKVPYLGPAYDLHRAALDWIEKQSFSSSLSIYFETTLQAKLARIQRWSPDFFIDDLPEVLACLPSLDTTRPVLFDPQNIYPLRSEWIKVMSWKEMKALLKP